MNYNFDQPIDRRGTDCSKVDGLEKVFGRDDVLPLWVADMEFRTPPFIMQAIRKRCDHEVFGYTFAGPQYYEAIQRWLLRKHRWTVETDWLMHVPGIVKGIAFAIQCFTQPGDKVVIQTPVYHPFRFAIDGLDRIVVNNPLRLDAAGRYHMDFESLEATFRSGGCKMLILCSPHNPGGVVWSKDTLQRLASLCAHYGVLVLADEIHGELVYLGTPHFPFASVSGDARDNSITFMSPSKTFNIPGIVTSYTVTPNDRIRRLWSRYLSVAGFGEGSVFSYVATQAAYNHGDEWVSQLIDYIQGNVSWVISQLDELLPAIKAYPPQASFLLWLDCRQMGLSHDALRDLFVNTWRLGLNDGAMFGTEGEGFMRMNVGCPRPLLQEAMHRIRLSM
ncbi:MAG: PatB family C-S lyase [Tannerellaceae bacterium]|jgi:cystathionine beta-lyase|nr:PatB family C-S lyase [Tannerellaceae bacterium]